MHGLSYPKPGPLPPSLLLLCAGVVGFDILKSLAPCPSLSYWLRATAMVPVTLLTLLGVR